MKTVNAVLVGATDLMLLAANKKVFVKINSNNSDVLIKLTKQDVQRLTVLKLDQQLINVKGENQCPEIFFFHAFKMAVIVSSISSS